MENACRRLTLQAEASGRVQMQGGYFTYWSDKRHYFYCMIPKVSSLSLREYLHRLGDFKRCQIKKVSKQEVNCTLRGRMLHLENYYKFMFVREPLYRLFSAYNNKMISRPRNDYLYEHYSQLINIIKKNHRKSTNDSLQGEISICYIFAN